MLSLFKRHQIPAEPATFNERVQAFWKWFQEVAPEFRKTIDEGKCGSLGEITSAKVDELFTGFAWVYGPAAEGEEGHSLTVSGEGVECKQLLALHWLENAPEIDGWTFYAARQPSQTGGYIKIKGNKIDPKEIWITPCINEEGEEIDLTVWHPLWTEIEKKDRWSIVFLFLDEALGEYGTKSWIGEIRLENDRLKDSFPLAELPEFVQQLEISRGWKKYPPGVGYSLLSIEPSEQDFPRSDLMTLSTATPQLFWDYHNAKGEMEDPFTGAGADYVYVSFGKSLLTAGQEVSERGELEQLLDAALKAESSGRCIGGGYGTKRGYVDLLIYDGKRSLDLVVAALKGSRLGKGATIEYFAKEKRRQVVRV